MDARPQPISLPTDPSGEFPMRAPEYVLYLLYQVERQRQQTLERALSQHGITLAQWRAMAVIRRGGICAMSTVSKLSGIDRTTLTRAVDQLVKDGIVERQGLAKDRRKVMLVLTKAGLKLYDKALQVLVTRSEIDTRDIPDKRMREAARALQAMVVNIVADPVEADEILGFLAYTQP
jgi:DNA-binding MarR family transcriptional regulator